MLEKLTFYLPVKKPYTAGNRDRHHEGVENPRRNAPLTASGVENQKGRGRLQSTTPHHLTVGGSHG